MASDAPELRASHADRDRVVDVLRIAAGDGFITAAELDERLDAALTARTQKDLAVLTADLPAGVGGPPRTAAQPKDLVRIDQAYGEVTRTGRWTVPRRMEIRLVVGKVKLDFSEAAITEPEVHVDIQIEGSGEVVVITRPGIFVDTDDLTLGFGHVKVRHEADAPAPVSLRVELAGQIRHGKVIVRSRRARRKGAR
jgi:hypothetical protein